MPTKPWTPLRVSKFTRNLHPDDYQPGLPLPGPIEDDSRYQTFRVRKNDNSEWVGADGTVNLWLVKNMPTEEQLAAYAQSTQAQETEVPPTKRAARKQREKRKAVQ